MTGENQVDAAVLEVAGYILGMVAEQNPVPGLTLKVIQPAECWFGFPGPDTSVRFRVQERDRLCFPPGLISGKTCGTQASAADLCAADVHGDKTVVENRDPVRGDQRQIRLVQHPFMVAEGDKGWCNGGAAAQQIPGLRTVLHFEPTGNRGRVCIDKVSSQQNERRLPMPEAFENGIRGPVMGICHECDGHGTGGDRITGFDHRRCSFPVGSGVDKKSLS